MAKSKTIKKLEEIEKEHGIDVSDIISEVEELFDDNEELEDDVKRLKDEVEELEDENEELEDKVDKLKDEVEELEKAVFESESKDSFEFENKVHNNLRTQSALEDLFKNMDYIPIDKLEAFINRHKKL